MSNPPPAPINYATPSTAPSHNSPKKFFLRALLGFAAVFVALIFGFGLASLASAFNLASENGIILIFLAPLVLTFFAALALTIWRRRFGYVTGIITGTILAFSLLVLAVFLFLAIVFNAFRP